MTHTRSYRPGLYMLLGFVALLAVAYVVLHMHKYGECVATPGIFNWPSQCTASDPSYVITP